MALLLANAAFAQDSHSKGDQDENEIAPTCAGCIGEARMLGANHTLFPWSFSARYLPTGDKVWRERYTLDRRVNPRLSVGMEYTPGRNEVLPRSTWFVSPEHLDYPSVTLGWTSDRLSTEKGQAVFLTFAKVIPNSPVTLIGSIKYGTEPHRAFFPFGANVRIRSDLTLQAVNDGNYTHWMLTHTEGNRGYSLVLAKTRFLGGHVSINF